MLVAGGVSAQPGPTKNPGVTPQVGRVLPIDLDFEQCLREKVAETRLAEEAANIVSLRDRRTFWEGALKTNYTLRSRYPNGYDQMLAESFEQYRSMGGVAATVNAVREIPLPCVKADARHPK